MAPKESKKGKVSAPVATMFRTGSVALTTIQEIVIFNQRTDRTALERDRRHKAIDSFTAPGVWHFRLQSPFIKHFELNANFPIPGQVPSPSKRKAAKKPTSPPKPPSAV